MKRILLLVTAVLVLFSCNSRKSTTYTKPKASTNSKSSSLRNLTSKYGGKNNNAVGNILEDAENYLGTPYKYGGTTKSGFDCSGFVTTVYNGSKIKLPRRSQDIALEGEKIEVSETKPGDLIFFATSGNGSVSHVGIVHEIKYKGEITFIHASTSKGVIISSLNETYWNKAFLFVRRVL